MAMILHSTTTALRDLTSPITVLSQTPDASKDKLIQLHVQMGDGVNDLDGTGGTFTFALSIGSKPFNGATQNITLDAGTTTSCHMSQILSVPANQAVTLSIGSPNAGDSNVRVIVKLYDIPTGNVMEIGSDTQSATDIKDLADTGYDPSTHKVQGVVLVDTTTTNTDMVAAAPSAVAIRTEIDSNSTQLAAIVADTNELQTDWTNGGRLDLLLDGVLEDTGTTLPGTLSTISGYVDCLPATLDGSTLTAVPWNAAWDAEVQSECADALNAYDPPTNAEMEARTLAAASYFDPAADTVAHVTLVDTTTTNTDMRGTDGANTTTPLDAAGIRSAVGLAAANLDTQIADLPTVAEFEARTLVAASYFDPAADTVAHVTLVDTTTTNTDMRGTDNAALASVCTETRLAELDAANLPADVDAIRTDTGTTIPGTITTMQGNVTDILADTGELQTDWVDGGRLDLILDTAAAGGGLDAAGVRAAVGLDAANLDTQLAAIVEDTGTTLPATLSTIEGKIDTADGVIDNVWGAVNTEVAAIKDVTDKLDTGLELDGAAYRWTTNALENAPGGSTSVTILPISSVANDDGSQNATSLTAYQHAAFTLTITCTDADGNAVDLSGDTLAFVVWDESDASTDIFTIPADAGSITVSGDGDNIATVAGTAALTATAYRSVRWRLIATDSATQRAHGYLTIEEMAAPPS